MADVGRARPLDILNGDMRRHLRRDVVYSVKRFKILHKEGKLTEWRDLEYYYSILTDRDIPSCRAVLLKLASEQFPSKYRLHIHEYLLAAHERYEQALFARDIIDKLVKKSPDNSLLFLANFHTWYFIVLINALGDNLAWIVNYFYDIGLESCPKTIGLNNKEFRSRLNDREIFKKICEGSGYEGYNILTKFRRTVVHREELGILQVLDRRSGQKRIMIPRDPLNGAEFQSNRTRSKYAVSKDMASISMYGRKRLRIVSDPDKDHENLVPFCSRHLRFIAESYNAVLAEMVSAR